MFSIWTKERLLRQVSIYQDALDACGLNKSYTIGSHTYTRNDIPHLRDHLNYLRNELAALPENGGVRGPVFVQAVFPRGRR